MEKKLTKAFVKRLLNALPDKYDCEHTCSYGCNNLICVYSYEADARKEVRDNVLLFLKVEGLINQRSKE